MPKPARRKSLAQKRATRPNKAQLRAAEVRAEQMAADAPQDEEIDAEDALESPVKASVVTPVAPAVAQATTRSTRGAPRQPAARVKTLSHAEEFEFIKADLRRLLYTFGAVLVVMVALLFVIEQ